MINFEEELKKFQPSMEVEYVENAIYEHDLTDMTDIFFEFMKNEKAAQEAAILNASMADVQRPM
ncbi:MAG: hypothetical protein K5931_03940 [Lachnospiraceae bacterium]|nr:hypothetical protein [Lachnospiraceae bacterium]